MVHSQLRKYTEQRTQWSLGKHISSGRYTAKKNPANKSIYQYKLSETV